MLKSCITFFIQYVYVQSQNGISLKQCCLPFQQQKENVGLPLVDTLTKLRKRLNTQTHFNKTQ